MIFDYLRVCDGDISTWINSRILYLIHKNMEAGRDIGAIVRSSLKVKGEEHTYNLGKT